MKVATLFAALIGSAAAFAPASQTQQRPATEMSAWIEEQQVGITAPAGYFDPMGFSKGKSDEVMKFYREAELKHGRVAMAACLGWYVTAGGTHPAFNSSLSSDPLKAAQELPFVGWLQFILGCGAIEWLAQQIAKRPGYVPGDILGTSQWVDNTDESWVSYQNKEINNGRLAMLAFMGIFAQDAMTGEYGDMIFRQV